MSRLEYYNRPLVAFDPMNKQHRAYFNQFLLTRAWGRCPVRFICPDEHGPEGLVGIVSRQLLEYYSRKEFNQKTNPKKNSKPQIVERQPKVIEIDKKILAYQNKQKEIEYDHNEVA